MNTTNEDDAPLPDAPLSEAEIEAAALDLLRCPSPVADELLEQLVKLHGIAGMRRLAPGWEDIVKPSTPGIKRTAQMLWSVTCALRKRKWGVDLSGLSVLALALRKELCTQFDTVGIDKARIAEFMRPKA